MSTQRVCGGVFDVNYRWTAGSLEASVGGGVSECTWRLQSAKQTVQPHLL